MATGKCYDCKIILNRVFECPMCLHQICIAHLGKHYRLHKQGFHQTKLVLAELQKRLVRGPHGKTTNA